MGNRDPIERSVWTTLGTALLLAGLGPRAGRRLRWAGLAVAGCSITLLAITIAMAAFGVGLLLAGGLFGRRPARPFPGRSLSR